MSGAGTRCVSVVGLHSESEQRQVRELELTSEWTRGGALRGGALRGSLPRPVRAHSAAHTCFLTPRGSQPREALVCFEIHTWNVLVPQTPARLAALLSEVKGFRPVFLLAAGLLM